MKGIFKVYVVRHTQDIRVPSNILIYYPKTKVINSVPLPTKVRNKANSSGSDCQHKVLPLRLTFL